MNSQAELEHLKAELAALQKKSRKSGWLFRQLLRKFVHFPRDLSRRLRKSRHRRRDRAARDAQQSALAVVRAARDPFCPSSGPARSAAVAGRAGKDHAQAERPFGVVPAWDSVLTRLLAGSGDARADLAAMARFRSSDAFRGIMADAIALDPNVAVIGPATQGYLPPWFDGAFDEFRRAAELLPEGPVDTVILVPFGKMGGADFVAGLLSQELAARGRCVILRTELSDWDRPDWYAAGAQAIDLSVPLSQIAERPRALYHLLQLLRPRAVYNVNSRLGFETFDAFGARMAEQFDLHAYYFCADYTAEGHEAGYPVWYVSQLLPHLTSAIIDTAYLRDRLAARYRLPAHVAARLRTVYTPFAGTAPDRPVAVDQAETATERARPKILWAARLDRQKRFDLLQEIARRMPDVDFHAWGKAVLDAPPDVARLPANVTLHKPFAHFDDLPLGACDGWLYTSAWDGLPTILIEIAGLGMPIVASAVGGVPELIDGETGWPVEEADDPAAYVDALRAMLADPQARIARGTAAMRRVAERHSRAAYASALFPDARSGEGRCA